jgi:hypothetical protein
MSNFLAVSRDIEEAANMVIARVFVLHPEQPARTLALTLAPIDAARLVAGLWRETIPKHRYEP